MKFREDPLPQLNAEKTKLLRQAEEIMDLAQDVSSPDQDVPEGWKILVDSSPNEKNTAGFFARVYERTDPFKEKESKYAVAFRGTYKLLSDPQDLNADLAIALGHLPDQYAQALTFVQSACKEQGLNPAEMEFVGYSLGGYLAKTVGATLNARKIWTFNSPGPTEEIRDYVEHLIPGISSPPGKRLVQMRSVYDLISRWGYNEGIILEVKTVGGPHSLVSLRQGINDAINGQALPPSTPEKGPLSLSSIFNAFSKKMSQSKVVNKIINIIVGQTKRSKNIPHDV